MLRLRALLLSLLAVLALMSPSVAMAWHVAQDGCGPYVSSAPAGEPVHLPSACELWGGKRVMPAGAELGVKRDVELPRETDAQWQFGLSNDQMREGRDPMMELRPPRAA